MSQRDFKLLNPWYSEQMFIWDDEPSKRATIVHEWSDNIKQRLGMKLGAMEWEAHAVEKGIPCIIYHELTTNDLFCKNFLWINIGVEPKMSPFGGKEFYEDMKENFSSVLGIHNNLFLPIPIPSDEIFLKYTYVSYGFDNESDIKSNISNIATFIGRGPPRPPLDYCHGKVSKLGVGKPPLSRLWKEELGDDNKTQLTNFIYPDIFIIHATPWIINWPL